MEDPTFAYVVWEDGRKSVIRCNTITEGVASPGQNVMIRWKKQKRMYRAKVIAVGKANTICDRICKKVPFSHTKFDQFFELQSFITFVSLLIIT